MDRKGEIRKAMAAQARQEPGTLRELAQRAGVGFSAARYTGSRMLGSGELVILRIGRPAVFGPPDALQEDRAEKARVVAALDALAAAWMR